MRMSDFGMQTHGPKDWDQHHHPQIFLVAADQELFQLAINN